MGPGQKILLLELGQPFLVWVWKIIPKNPKFSNFFPSGQKKSHRVRDGLASYLLVSGQGPSLQD